jgi:hypothetical protein
MSEYNFFAFDAVTVIGTLLNTSLLALLIYAVVKIVKKFSK